MSLQEAIDARVRAGATIGVTLANGTKLEPWPVAYCELTGDDMLQWYWIGDDQQLHAQKVASSREDDYLLEFTTREGDVIALEPIWNDEDRRRLRKFASRPDYPLAGYPAGGSTYANV